MKTSILFLTIFVSILRTSAQTDRKGIIPFDSASNRYTYVKILDLPNSSASDLYQKSKKWLVDYFHDEKLLIDELNVRTVDRGSFEVKAVLDAGMIEMPFLWVVIYDISIYVKDNKCKLEMTSFKLSGNSEGTTAETTLEGYEKNIEDQKRGKKKGLQMYLYDLFKAIDSNSRKTISDFEKSMKGDAKTKEW